MTDIALEKANKAAQAAAEKLAELQAVADEKAAQVAAERAERAKAFDQRTADTWQEEAKRLADEHQDGMRRFMELLQEEPWFEALLAARTARWAHVHFVGYANSAKYRATGQRTNGNMPNPGPTDSPFLDLIMREGERIAKSRAADYMDERAQERERFINGEVE
ncbi:hypothetical protein [Streptomyces gobiensis]|uniref:hypothetical protein n=1 Tax=Streptomyces gobiensis TaxID=2875706 RepID=UPI001E4E6A4D|nr:hypothetical protein [Streptomyces gobiensis]UGY94052.1 hypothetical protein test1122_21600 [Streptomyces gobiensis]